MGQRSRYRHYHVVFGTVGYTPDLNYTCATRRIAECTATELARQLRDDNWEEKDFRVTGSARSGYYTVGDYEYIRIVICDGSECDGE